MDAWHDINRRSGAWQFYTKRRHRSALQNPFCVVVVKDAKKESTLFQHNEVIVQQEPNGARNVIHVKVVSK
jgi:hypothetical protein